MDVLVHQKIFISIISPEIFYVIQNITIYYLHFIFYN